MINNLEDALSKHHHSITTSELSDLVWDNVVNPSPELQEILFFVNASNETFFYDYVGDVLAHRLRKSAIRGVS